MLKIETSGIYQGSNMQFGNSPRSSKALRYTIVNLLYTHLVFGQESTYHQGKLFQIILQGMSVCQKLGVILESKVFLLKKMVS